MNALIGPSGGSHMATLVPDLWALVKALRAFLDALLDVVDVLADLTESFRAASA